MEKFSEFMGNLFENIRSKPGLAGLCIAGIGFLMFIAVLMDADWMLEGGNGKFNIASISRIFGRKVARILMGIATLSITVAGLIMAWGYYMLTGKIF